MAEDKRVRRTKKLLRQALAELMQEKEFKNITVSDVVRCADINRGTFYTYYRDVFDLRERVENEMVDTLRGLLDGITASTENRTLLPVIEQVVAYLHENNTLAYALLNDRGMGTFEEKLTALMEEYGRSLRVSFGEVDDFTIWFAVSGCIGVIKKWLTANQPSDREAVLRRIDALLCGILCTF